MYLPGVRGLNSKLDIDWANDIKTGTPVLAQEPRSDSLRCIHGFLKGDHGRGILLEALRRLTQLQRNSMFNKKVYIDA